MTSTKRACQKSGQALCRASHLQSGVPARAFVPARPVGDVKPQRRGPCSDRTDGFSYAHVRCIVPRNGRPAHHGRHQIDTAVDFGASRSIGPGKIRLLEAVDRTGSISQAGLALGMSYRRAWLLIDDMNRNFRHAVVSARPGGSQGGGAAVTEFGTELVRNYRAIETAAADAARLKLRTLEAALRKSPREYQRGATGAQSAATGLERTWVLRESALLKRFEMRYI